MCIRDRYTIEDLRSVLNSIDRTQYPERAQEVENRLSELLSDPKSVLDSKSQTDFFKSHIPSEIVTSVWLRMFGWSFVTGLVIGLPLTIVLSFILLLFNLAPETVKAINLVAYWIVCLGFSWLLLRRILGTTAGRYEIIFRKKEN